MGTRTGSFFLKGPDINNSISELILFNKLLDNLCSLVWELVLDLWSLDLSFF